MRKFVVRQHCTGLKFSIEDYALSEPMKGPYMDEVVFWTPVGPEVSLDAARELYMLGVRQNYPKGLQT